MINGNSFINDIFSGDTSNKINQELKYNYVRAYPSVNSTNGGQIHSEENIKWLTKQFVRKPFIIPYTNTEEQPFEYHYDNELGGICNSGMANINGYIINVVNDINKTSFDNADYAQIGTDEIGYIHVQKLYTAIQRVMQGLNSISIQDYMTGSAELEEITDLVNNPNRQQERQTFCDTHGISIAELTVGNYLKLTATIDKLFTHIADVKISYDSEITQFIKDNFDINELNISEESTDTELLVLYPIIYGVPNDKLQPSDTNQPIPVIFLTDVFKFTYVWDDSVRLQTATYPSTLNSDINMLLDTVTPESATIPDGLYTPINPKMFEVDNRNVIYDSTALYTKAAITTTDRTHAEYQEMLKRSKIYNDVTGSFDETEFNYLENFKLRNDNITDSIFHDYTFVKNLTHLNVENNEVFNVISSANVISYYQRYTNTLNSNDSADIEKLKKFIKDTNICDNYYCLPVSRFDRLDDNTVFNAIFGLYTYDISSNKQYAPVGFLTSSGKLIAENISYTEDGNTYVLIEGYIPFIRRMCKILMSGYGDLSKYGDLSDYSKNTEGWNQLIKDLEIKGANLESVTYSNYILQLFDKSSAEDKIRFSDVYNKFIAPYMNFHMQLAWTGLFINTMTNGQGYKSHGGAEAIKNKVDIAESDYTVDNNGDVLLSYTHNYTTDTQTISIDREVKYTVNNLTDYDRLNNYLCDINELEELEGSDITYRNKINLSTSDKAKKLNMCEDFITFLKRCSVRGYDDTYSNNNKINIPHKLTTLDPVKNEDTYLYGFKEFDTDIVDRYAKYTTISANKDDLSIDIYKQGEAGQEVVYDNQTGTIITPVAGYIQNVTIDLNTFTPYREDSNDSDFLYPKTIATSEEIWTDINALDDSPISTDTYALSYNAHSILTQIGTNASTIDGYSFLGNAQSWIIGVPMLLRLYLNGQNHLEGKKRAYDTHAGVVVDFKLPYAVKDEDFWFANVWISNICTMSTWELESNCANIPKNTDGMQEYLRRRNTMIIPFEYLYGKDGDLYVTLEEYVNKFLEGLQFDFDSQIKAVEDKLNAEILYLKSLIDKATNSVIEYFSNLPSLNFADYIIDEDDKCIYEIKEYKGVINNLERLYKYINDHAWTTTTYIQKTNKLTIENSKYYNLADNVFNKKDILFVEPMSGDRYRQAVTDNRAERFALCTKDNDNIMRMSVRLRFKDKMYVKLLDRNLNKATTDINEQDYIHITWGSNYPVKRTTGYPYTSDVVACDIYTITLDDWYKKAYCEVLLDISVAYDKTNESAIGYVEVKQVANNRLLTDMDMSYLWHDLYKLNRIPWSRVSELTQIGMAEKLWELGDTKTMKLIDEETGTEFEVSAMIIGFNQDGENTITWLSNIYNNEGQDILNPLIGLGLLPETEEQIPPQNTPVTTAETTPTDNPTDTPTDNSTDTPENNTDNNTPGNTPPPTPPELTEEEKSERFRYLFDKKFNTYYRVAQKKDAHDIVVRQATCTDGYNACIETESDVTEAFKGTAAWRWLNDANGITKYMDTEVMKIIKPVEKISRMLYLVKTLTGYRIYSDDAAYYKEFTPTSETSMFWLPTLGELGINYEDIDDAERLALDRYRADHPTEDVVTLRKNPTGKCKEFDTEDNYEKCYEYFTLPTAEQNVKSLTLLCRSFYAVRSDEVDAISNDFDNDRHIYDSDHVWKDYKACPRTAYCVGTGYDSNATSGRWLTVLDRDDIRSVLRDRVLTDFCFVTE